MWENQKVNLLAAGNRHFLATDEAGDLYAMGRNGYGQLGAYTANPDDYNDVLVSISTAGFTDIAAGGNSSFAVTEEGKLYVWGSNENGCLGLPYWQFEVFEPFGVDTEYDYVFEGAEVFANGETTFLALPDNSLIPWGSNNEGLYGIGKTGAPSMSLEKFAVDVSSVDDPIIMSADGGGDHDSGSFGIFCSQDGTVWGWGVNDSGQLGLGDTDFRATPAQASIPEDIKKVAAGDNFVIVNDSIEDLWGWGQNDNGQLGKGDNDNATTPTLVSNPFPGKCYDFDCGSAHVLALYDDNDDGIYRLFAWGVNLQGQLGLGDDTDRNSPEEVTGFDASITDISCGSFHSVVLDKNGNVWTWGSNESGQLGDGTTTDRNTPYKLEKSSFGGQAVVDVEAGGGVSFAITEDDRLWAWGDKGTLGYDYEYDDVDSTEPIPYLDNIRFVASAGGSLIVYTKDGILYYMDDGIDPTLMEYEESEYISDVEGNGIILRESDIWSHDGNLQVIEGGGGGHFFLIAGASIDDGGTLYAF
jgi:alpha-tubulin suppressor-like RCC1 family protein